MQAFNQFVERTSASRRAAKECLQADCSVGYVWLFLRLFQRTWKGPGKALAAPGPSLCTFLGSSPVAKAVEDTLENRLDPLSLHPSRKKRGHPDTHEGFCGNMSKGRLRREREQRECTAMKGRRRQGKRGSCRRRLASGCDCRAVMYSKWCKPFFI